MRGKALCIAILTTLTLRATVPGGFSIEDAVSDIYADIIENGEADQEELQNLLTELVLHPINLNTACEGDLQQLRFLSDKQIYDILAHAQDEPFHSLSELLTIRSLKDYEIRRLLPLVTIDTAEIESPAEPLHARQVFKHAQHELLARVDARNIEANIPDPVYTSLRYTFHFRNQVQAGFTLRRPVAGQANDLQYGAYIELHDLWRFRTIVAGNYQASFGEGLVMSNAFHMGKSIYVMNTGAETNSLRKYTGTDGASLHGIGATIRAHRYVDISAFYSMTAANDSVHKHTLGTNLTVRYKQLRVGVTAIENIYTDSLRYYYENAGYNQNYFRGDRQAVIGLNARWNYGIVDLFGEIAAAQNRQWGWAAIAGLRVYPVSDVGLMLLYRYYSPTYDNTWGYAFSETSRINDENGLYMGADIRSLRHWRFSLYGDIFRFSGIKYGIPYSPSMGYDTQANIQYIRRDWNISLRLRAREKAKKNTFSGRLQANWQSQNWLLKTELNANLVLDSLHQLSFGASISQDVQYSFQQIPMTLQLRLMTFDARQWDNRIYQYENDVLYGYSIPATYGLGGRAYMNIRWQIIPQLALYLKFSETIYSSLWMHDHLPHRTDIHLLLRAKI